MVTGTCRCHGVTVTGVKGTVAQPGPYRVSADPFGGGPKVWCVAVQEHPDWQPHDVLVSTLTEVHG